MASRDVAGAPNGERPPAGHGPRRASARVLHTGDWHLGRRLFGIERLDDAREVLAEITEVARAERVDAVLVAGDLLDRKLVEPDVLAVCVRALEDLADVAPVVAVTGNHDDPAFWATLAPYLRQRRIVLHTSVPSPEAVIETVPTAEGALIVGCVPWIESGYLPAGGASELAVAVGDALTRVAAEHGHPTILLGHLMIQGARLGGGERELTVRDAHGIAGAALPAAIDYIALGHIHLAQALPGFAGAGRYSGSPQQLDFGESAQTPQVAIVDIDADGTNWRSVPLTRGRRLVRLRGSLAEMPALAAAHEGAWFLCEIEAERVVPDLVREVRALVPDALRVETRYPGVEEVAVAQAEHPATQSLGEHYADWYRTTERPLAPEQMAAFEAAVEAREAD